MSWLAVPNVGKSTLFNALTRRRDAIVADQPGVTRDRQYGEGRVGDRPYLVVDTGGLATQAQGIAALMTAQSRQAMVEADAIVFVVDGAPVRVLMTAIAQSCGAWASR